MGACAPRGNLCSSTCLSSLRALQISGALEVPTFLRVRLWGGVLLEVLGWSLTPATFARIKAFHGVLHSPAAFVRTTASLTFEARARLAYSSQPPPRTQTSSSATGSDCRALSLPKDPLPHPLRLPARPSGPKQAAQPARAFFLGPQEDTRRVSPAAVRAPPVTARDRRTTRAAGPRS